MSRKFRFTTEHKKPKINLFRDKDEFESCFSGAHFELFSNRELTVEGCKGVAEYKENYLKLNLGKGSIILWGEAFDILRYENDVITVSGKISTLEFCV